MLVGRRVMTAALTGEFRLGDAIGGGYVTAVLAAVRGVAGIDLNQCAPSVFRFGAQNRDELAQPASLILLLSPDFARAPLGRNCPRFSTSGTGLARRTMLAIAKSSTTRRS